MSKIKVELEVMNSEYCDSTDGACKLCMEDGQGVYYCALFDTDLEIDEKNNCFCKRCEQCKQAEVEE